MYYLINNAGTPIIGRWFGSVSAAASYAVEADIPFDSYEIAAVG